ncbi:MAG TPA: hypothetical protein VEK39_10040 [Solirubrobacterales bacterium]|nr:hypothetical protein [Solirubrobacterales bacterium]
MGPDLGQVLKPEQRLLEDAIEREAEAHRLLLAGEVDTAHVALIEAAVLYRRSWEAAPPRAYGRLVGMLKAAVIAGEGTAPAAYVRRALGSSGDSPTSWYAIGLAALIEGDDPAAITAARGMRDDAAELGMGAEAFTRVAEAIAALAYRNADRYAEALEAIVADFERREEHLTGVPIADTALMLERLAAERDIAAGARSKLLPTAPAGPGKQKGGVEPGTNG